MLQNRNYYNSYMPYNNSVYYSPAPVYSNIETNLTNDNTKELKAAEIIEKEIDQDFSDETSTSNKDRLSLFGLSLNIDDIIIIGIVIFLFMENKKDYLLLIILGLILFDITTDTFKNMNIFKQLFNPS